MYVIITFIDFKAFYEIFLKIVINVVGYFIEKIFFCLCFLEAILKLRKQEAALVKFRETPRQQSREYYDNII